MNDSNGSRRKWRERQNNNHVDREEVVRERDRTTATETGGCGERDRTTATEIGGSGERDRTTATEIGGSGERDRTTATETGEGGGRDGTTDSSIREENRFRQVPGKGVRRVVQARQWVLCVGVFSGDNEPRPARTHVQEQAELPMKQVSTTVKESCEPTRVLTTLGDIAVPRGRKTVLKIRETTNTTSPGRNRLAEVQWTEWGRKATRNP